MAITVPTELVIVPGAALVQPPMAANPLDTILKNSNHLYRYFRPPLVSFVPIDGVASRDRSYVVPVVPSADGLSYTFQHRILPATTGSVDIKVEGNSGVDPSSGWSTLYGPASSGSLTGGAWATVAHSATLAPTVTMLRISYLGAGADLTIGHVLAFPAPSSVASGVKPSGFIPYDDGLLSVSGAPVTTEMVNRMRTNALAVLRDRRQVVASLVQQYDTSAPWSNGYAAPSVAVADQPMRIGKSVATLPGQTRAGLTLYAVANVSGGATADLIEVLLGSVSVRLGATGLLVSESVTVDLPGGAAATLPVEVRTHHTTGHSCYLQSLVILWRPGD